MTNEERALVYLSIIYFPTCECEGEKTVLKSVKRFPMPEIIEDGYCFLCQKEMPIKISEPIRFYVLEEGKEFNQKQLAERKVSQKSPYMYIISAYQEGIDPFICEECNSITELCHEVEPWSEEHWICPKCDSTYVKEFKR